MTNEMVVQVVLRSAVTWQETLIIIGAVIGLAIIGTVLLETFFK